MRENLELLHSELKKLEKLAVALSGGLDSSFLFVEAAEALGPKNIIGIHIISPLGYPEETGRVKKLADITGASIATVEFSELDVPGFDTNPPDRCYICKRVRFDIAKAEAAKRGFDTLADGTNADDDPRVRPGMKAAEEFRVVHPLRDAGLTKADIRALAKSAGYDFWDIPPQSCAMTRFPHGYKVDGETINRIKEAETEIRRLGLWLVRVRYSGGRPRLEIDKRDIAHAKSLKSEIAKILKEALDRDIMEIAIEVYKAESRYGGS